MNERQPESQAGSPPDRISWVRKRDGSVVVFDPAKIVGAIFAARSAIDEEDAAFAAQEHSQAVLHFLAHEIEGQIPTTEEISEAVVKILRELGQGPTAAVYEDFRRRRREQRARVHVHDSAQVSSARHANREATDSPMGGPQAFDKARIAWSLETEAELDAATAREVAAAIEAKLLACGFRHVSTTFIRELADLELLDRGLERSGFRRRFLGIETRAVEEMLGRRPDPDAMQRWAGREVLRQYALQEVFSPDIAALHADGLVHLFETASPIHWSAASLDMTRLAARAAGSDAFLRDFEADLESVCRRVEGTVAIDCPEGVLALLAERDADAGRLAEITVDILRRAATRHRVYLAVNLRGRVSDLSAAGVSQGPLFRIRPTENQDRFAARWALRCAERLLEDPVLRDRARVDYHPDLALTDRDLEMGLGQWARWARKHPHLCFSFDRDQPRLAEGLPAVPHARAAVYQHVGIRLRDLVERMGRGLDEEALFERLGLLCESAVRAGVQKREFLRRQQPDFFAGRDYGNAVVVVTPIGLDALVAAVLGRPMGPDEAAVALAEQVLTRMRHRLQRAGRHYQLRTLLDGIPGVKSLAEVGVDAPDPAWLVIGNTTGVAGIGPRHQLFAAGRLHATIGGGTAQCRMGLETPAEPHDLLDLILFAARKTTVSRLQFVFPAAPRQLELAENWF